MKEKMLADWQKKNDILEFESYQVQKKIAYARQRQQSLQRDVEVSIITLIVDVVVLSCLFSMEADIMMGFDIIYAFVVRGCAIFTIPLFTYRLLRAVQRKAHHIRPAHPWVEPKARISASNVGLKPEQSYQTEIDKLSWISKKYEVSRQRMDCMYKRLQEGRENMDEKEWQDFLDSIIIYETIKPAQR